MKKAVLGCFNLIFIVSIVSTLSLAACGSEDAAPQPELPSPFVTKSPEGPPLDPNIFPKPGDTEFLTANENELLSSGTSTGNYAPGKNAADSLNGGAYDEDSSAPPASPTQPEPEQVPDPTREIVEADVFKLEGDLLYVLNRYRGLVIIDVANPDKMFIRGRLPFQAMPVEMYVRDGRAFIISSDYFEYWQYDPEADPHGFHGSQVMIADVSNPDQPKQIGSLHVDGEVTDTRMVGDVLYSVSKRRPDYWRYNTADWEDRTWIVSLNVADPAAIKEIDRITFQGMSTLIHVAHHAIFVAAWDPNYYLTNPALEQETLVTYVDISDPTGKLKERGKVYIPGQIADKFKMDWHDGYFRVFAQQWNDSSNVNLHVVSTQYPDQLKIDSALNITGSANYRYMDASRFDEQRAFVFTSEWLSGQRYHYLHSIDLSQPLQPTIAGTLNVDIDTNHIEVHADRLLVLGRHYQKTSYYYSYNKTALALYDVANLSAMSLLSLQDLGLGWSSSEANHDYKALKTFPKLELILVPLRYYLNGLSFNGVQLVDWVGDTLTERGRVENTGGVLRAFPVGNRLVAVGEMSIVAIDAQDRDKPVVTSQLKLVHMVHDVFEVQGYQVQLVTDVYSSQVRLEVRSFGPEDDGPTIAQLDLPFTSVPFVLRDGDALHLIGPEYTGTKTEQTVRNADLNDPLKPFLRGQMVLSDEFYTVFHPGWGWYNYYWSPQAGLPLRNQIVPATFREVIELPSGRREWNSELRFLDLTDLDNPRMAGGKIPMNDYPFVNKITHGEMLYSTHVEQATTPDGDSLLYHVRSYVDRVDVSDPDNPQPLASVNVPGYLVDISDDGSVWYTVDYQWDEFGRRRNSINVMRLINDDTAMLVEVIPVADQINRAALRPGQLSEKSGHPTGWNDRTIWLVAHKYPWWGVQSDTVSSRQPYTLLRRFDFSTDGQLSSEQKTTLQGYHFDLLDVQQNQIYLASRSPSGLLVVDAADMANPTIVHSARTIGYLSRIVVNGGYAYAPLGMYGLHRY